MVLGGQPPGRVGRRRLFPPKSRLRAALRVLRERPADEPVVSERVDDAALPHAVGLVSDREHLSRAGRDRMRLCRVRVVDVERDAHRRGACRLRARCPELGRLRRDAEVVAADRKDRDLARQAPYRSSIEMRKGRPSATLSANKSAATYSPGRLPSEYHRPWQA